MYLEGVGFYALGFEQVAIGVEGGELGGESGEFSQSVLSQRQFLQQGELGEGGVVDL